MVPPRPSLATAARVGREEARYLYATAGDSVLRVSGLCLWPRGIQHCSANGPCLTAFLAWSRGRADRYYLDHTWCGGYSCLGMRTMRVVCAGSRCAATTDADEPKLPEDKPEERLPEWCSEEFKAWWWRNCAG